MGERVWIVGPHVEPDRVAGAMARGINSADCVSLPMPRYPLSPIGSHAADFRFGSGFEPHGRGRPVHVSSALTGGYGSGRCWTRTSDLTGVIRAL